MTRPKKKRADFSVKSRADWFVHLESFGRWQEATVCMKLCKTLPDGPDQDDKYF